MVEAPAFTDDELREAASRSGRASLDAALQRYTGAQRDAFWNAIGLYYSTRRHPGAGDAKPEDARPEGAEPAAVAVAAASLQGADRPVAL